MSERVRRRRSLRINRPSGLLVPLISDGEISDCAGDDGKNNGGLVNSSVYNTTTALGVVDCGSFWEDVEENTLRPKRKSRRSNIGFFILKSGDDDNNSVKVSDNPEQVSEDEPDIPDIELPRRPCPEAEACVETPPTFLTEYNTRDTSQTKTPSLAGDKSLPYIKTPSSAGLGNSFMNRSVKRFEDKLMDGMYTPNDSQELNMSCPPSCEDDSEDSLLICTPDIAQFKKNIRFKCSLDFDEFDQTPSKGDNSLNNSQESIHESPIVGFMYDKLNASDVVRRRRSTSYKAGSLSVEKKKMNHAPRRLVTTSDEIKVNQQEDSLTKETNEMDTTELKVSKNLDITVASGTSSQSISTESSSGTYTSCVEDLLEDFLSEPSAPPSPLKSAAQSPQSKSPTVSTCLVTGCGDSQSPQPVTEHVDTALVSVTASSSPCEHTDESTPVPSCCDHVASAACEGSDRFYHKNQDSKVEVRDALPEADSQKEVELVAAVQKPDSEVSVLEHASDKPTELPENVVEPENKSKERNIANDVCDMFRSLARKFSGTRKKKRKSVGSRSKEKSASVENVKPNSNGTKSPLIGDDEASGIFSFRKEPKVPEQITDTSSNILGDAHGSKPNDEPKSLNFSPYLAAVKKDNAYVVTEPLSPVWKLQSENPDLVPANKNSKQTGFDTTSILDENVPLMIETVLQEKPINVESNKAQDTECNKEQNTAKVATKRSRPKRRSVERSILQQEVQQFQISEPLPAEEEIEEENTVQKRRSRRQRRSSLEMFRYQSQTPEEDVPSPDSQDSDTEYKPKKTRGKKKQEISIPEEKLEDFYRNKNYVLPTERMWETVFESPEKTKQPSLIQSKRKYRRTITFDSLPPGKIKKRLQRAAAHGWDVTGKKRMNIPIDEVKNKIAELTAELDS